MNLNTKSFFVSRYVVFKEHIFPFLQPNDVIPSSVLLMFESDFCEEIGDDSDPDLLTTTEVLPIDVVILLLILLILLLMFFLSLHL